jgi:hypothetical protein
VRLIEKARQQAIIFFQQDPDFSDINHAALYQKFQSFWQLGRGDLS